MNPALLFLLLFAGITRLGLFLATAVARNSLGPMMSDLDLYLWALLFAGIPLLELYLLIEVGSEIGAIPTIFLTVFTAVLGGLMVRVQGFSTALKVREVLDRGEVPAIEMIEGALLLLAGFLLLLPGFLTDAIGFLLLVPQIRRALVLWYLRRSGGVPTASPIQRQRRRESGPRVIEGEFRREDDDRGP